MEIIDGKKIAQEIRASLKEEVKNLNQEIKLAIILVGENDASEIYVRNKIRACEEIGLKSEVYRFTKDNTTAEIINCIKDLNAMENVYGIIVQSPVLAQFDEDYLTSFIDPQKDVDGFGIYSLGSLASGKENFLAATPYGIIKMLEYHNIDLSGKHVVIIGRSKIVGRPLALAMLNRHATVTITHSKTSNLKEITQTADILVVAIGKANYIDDSYIKEGAIVIDVGINRVNGKVVGDVNFALASKKASLITPVPGGVGPMTVAMLLNNVVLSVKKRGEKNWTKELKKP